MSTAISSAESMSGENSVVLDSEMISIQLFVWVMVECTTVSCTSW